MITKLNFKDKSIKSYAIRKLTAKEAFRLMGVRDAVIRIMQSTVAEAKARIKNWIGKGKDDELVVSTSQQYKQAGNSIVVDVLVGIIENVYYPSAEIVKKQERYKNIEYKVESNGQLSLF